MILPAFRIVASRTRRSGPVFAGGRRGAVLVLVGVCIFMLVSILALSIDAGSLQQQRRMAQTAADAGALAGAQEMVRGPARAFAIVPSALAEAQRNGFTDGVGGDVVTVTYPSTTAPFTGAGYVTVNVERTASNAFARIFGMATSVIRTQATAGLVPDDICIIALNPTAPNSLYLAQTHSALQADDCDIAVNSTSATGANLNGPLTADLLGVSGPSAGGSNIPANVGYNVPPTPDPLAYLTMPAIPATCDHIQRTNADNIAGTVTLNPGTYCGGMVLKPGAHVTLTQGLYILRGGGIDLTGGSGTSLASSGSGVTFLNTAPPPATEVANYDPSYAWRPINIQAATITVNLSADTRTLSALTPLPGILFYSDPAAPSLTNVFRAGSGSTMSGTMYFPTQTVEFQSGTDFTIAGGLIADKIVVSQNVTITFTGSAGGTFQGLKQATIVD